MFQLENGFFLLYYHRPEWWRMAFLYAKFLIPIGILIDLIRKNPFYKSYPAMLPILSVLLVCHLAAMVTYSRTTNRMIQQVLLDQTGSEVTFVY